MQFVPGAWICFEFLYNVLLILSVLTSILCYFIHFIFRIKTWLWYGRTSLFPFLSIRIISAIIRIPIIHINFLNYFVKLHGKKLKISTGITINLLAWREIKLDKLIKSNNSFHKHDSLSIYFIFLCTFQWASKFSSKRYFECNFRLISWYLTIWLLLLIELFCHYFWSQLFLEYDEHCYILYTDPLSSDFPWVNVNQI